MRLGFFLAATPFVLVVSAIKILPSFENTAIVRTVELGGSSVHVTTTYQARSLSKNNKVYYLALPRHQDDLTTWIEAKLKGSSKTLSVDKHGIEAMLATTEPVVYYSISLPKPLGINDTVSINVQSIESHASYPLPAVAKQTDTQSLVYETEAYVTSPYSTLNQRTKIKSPTPNIHSFSSPESLAQFAVTEPSTRSGATVTYGPFTEIPPSDSANFAKKIQETVKVHYPFDSSVITVAKLRRAAEISHWGANLNIQDDIILRNDGAVLDGHFSRLQHQQQTYYKQGGGGSAILGAVLQLPSGARDPYFTDIVGNVSTSRFRPSPKKSAIRSGGPERTSILEIKPRYPLLGGWNYSFTIGWDAPLSDSAKFDKSTGQYVVAVPFFTHLPGSVVDDAEVKIILPEGATDFQFYTPFAVDSIFRETHITYLDTKGRPTVTFSKKGLTEKHTGTIYITYKLSAAAHLQKVIAVSSAFALLFSLMYIVRRVDTRLTKTA